VRNDGPDPVVPADLDAWTEATSRTLADPAARVPASKFPRASDEVGLPGLYAWYVDEAGAAELSAGLGAPIVPGLIYAGQAGAGSSSATLRSRIRGNHIGGAITGSTFRMTLAAILAAELGLVDEGGRALAAEGETRLSGWMLRHLSIAVAAEPDRALVASLEEAVLARLDPPLNLQGMPPTPVRTALSARRRRPLGRGAANREGDAPRRIALVGCVKSKRNGTHPARDLYVSALFGKRRGYVEAAGLRWWILSAKHGLVRPDEPLAKYDETLNDMSSIERHAWGEKVLAQLRRELPDLDGWTVEIHAGGRYVDAIRPGLLERGAHVLVPTAGKGLGEQLAFYGKARPSAG
jgi:hypothetical protein